MIWNKTIRPKLNKTCSEKLDGCNMVQNIICVYDNLFRNMNLIYLSVWKLCFALVCLLEVHNTKSSSFEHHVSCQLSSMSGSMAAALP